MSRKPYTRYDLIADVVIGIYVGAVIAGFLSAFWWAT